MSFDRCTLVPAGETRKVEIPCGCGRTVEITGDRPRPLVVRCATCKASFPATLDESAVLAPGSCLVFRWVPVPRLFEMPRRDERPARNVRRKTA